MNVETHTELRYSRKRPKCCAMTSILLRLGIAVAISLTAHSASPFGFILIGIHVLNIGLYCGITAKQF